METELVTIITSLVGSLGFPIAVCVYMLINNTKQNTQHLDEVRNINEQHKEEVSKLSESIDSLKDLISEVVFYFRKGGDK